jgi:hypothetical protein
VSVSMPMPMSVSVPVPMVSVRAVHGRHGGDGRDVREAMGGPCTERLASGREAPEPVGRMRGVRRVRVLVVLGVHGEGEGV